MLYWRWYVVYVPASNSHPVKMWGSQWEQRWLAEADLKGMVTEDNRSIVGVPEGSQIIEVGVECVRS